MDKKWLWLACGCLALIPAAMVRAQPFPDNAQNRWAYEAVAELMIRAGMPDSAMVAFTSKKDLTRMEFAIWINSVMIHLEEQGLAVPPEISDKVEKLSAEFQREFLMLQLQEEVKQSQSRLERLLAPGRDRSFDLGGDFSLYAEKLDGRLAVSPEEQEIFGAAPEHTKVMLAQQLRIKCRAEVTPKLGGVLELRNFGYWGVGRYSSGSTDINFSSADPLKIDQAFVLWRRPGWGLDIGRKNLCYGIWGLLVNRRYEPINALELNWDRGAELRILLASQFSGLDFLAAQARTGNNRVRIGVAGFYTFFSRSEQEESGLRNDQGLGIDLALNGRKIGWRTEYALYKPDRTGKALQGYVHGFLTEWRLSWPLFLKTEFGLGKMAENFLVKSMPLDLIPMEFPKDEENIFRPGTKGFRLAQEAELCRQVVFRVDWITMVRDNGAFGMNQAAGRLALRLHQIIDIILEDSYIYGQQQRYNQAGGMIKISF